MWPARWYPNRQALKRGWSRSGGGSVTPKASAATKPLPVADIQNMDSCIQTVFQRKNLLAEEFHAPSNLNRLQTTARFEAVDR